MNCLIFIAVLFCFVSSHYAADMVDTNNVTTIEKATTCKVTEYLLALQDDCKFGYDTIHGLWLGLNILTKNSKIRLTFLKK